MTNCVNCGAPLSGNQCQYCGTEYNTADFSEPNYAGPQIVAGRGGAGGTCRTYPLGNCYYLAYYVPNG